MAGMFANNREQQRKKPMMILIFRFSENYHIILEKKVMFPMVIVKFFERGNLTEIHNITVYLTLSFILLIFHRFWTNEYREFEKITHYQKFCRYNVLNERCCITRTYSRAETDCISQFS